MKLDVKYINFFLYPISYLLYIKFTKIDIYIRTFIKRH